MAVLARPRLFVILICLSPSPSLPVCAQILRTVFFSFTGTTDDRFRAYLHLLEEEEDGYSRGIARLDSAGGSLYGPVDPPRAV